MLPLTLKETVMHHGHSEKENEESENQHEERRDDSREWPLLLRVGRRVGIFIHPSRLNSSPGIECSTEECRTDSRHSSAMGHFEFTCSLTSCPVALGGKLSAGDRDRFGRHNHSTVCTTDHTSGLAAGNRRWHLLAASCRLLAIGYWLLAIGYWLLAFSPTIYGPRLSTPAVRNPMKPKPQYLHSFCREFPRSGAQWFYEPPSRQDNSSGAPSISISYWLFTTP